MDFSLGKYLLHGRLEPLDMQTFQIPVTKVVDDVEKPAPNNSQEHPNLVYFFSGSFSFSEFEA